MSLLEVQNLSAGYQRVDGKKISILHIPHFGIAPQTLVCMKGRSGSGKTTFLNVISGILTPFSGVIKFQGVELNSLNERERDKLRGEKIGFVFQTFNLLPGFTSLENVILGSVFAGDPDEETLVTKQRAQELLVKVGLEHRFHHLPRHMSSGEQQRVAIARAFMNRPELVLADEPTGSLDEATGNSVLDLMMQLSKDSKASLLLVTHDTAVMKRFQEVIDLKELNKAATP